MPEKTQECAEPSGSQYTGFLENLRDLRAYSAYSSVSYPTMAS